MSILAEPRRKQRISVDPQNLQWRDDDNKVSKKMMEKMGWKDGKGLGRNAHGNVDAVKLKANHSGKGLGCDKMASYDSTWIGHHDDFADLLAALNKNKPQEDETEEQKKERNEKLSIELSSKSVKRRIHYQKFTRMKDTANYSAQDKSAVLGVGLKRVKVDSPEVKKVDPEEAISERNTTVSTLSVGDYFAQKLAALKAKSMTCATAVKQEVTVKEEIDEEEGVRSFSMEVKKEEVEEDEAYGRPSFQSQNYSSFAFSYDSQPVEVAVKDEVVEEDEEEERKRRKAEKKALKKQRKAEVKAKEEAEAVQVKEEVVEEEEMTEKQRRKMEKRLRKQKEREENGEAVEEEEEPPKKKKRVAEDTTESEKPKKQKKNKD